MSGRFNAPCLPGLNGAEALLTKPIDFGTLCSEIDMRVQSSRL